MRKARAFLFHLVVLAVSFSASSCFNVPLPGGTNIRFEDGGLIRIQYDKGDSSNQLPAMPKAGTIVSPIVLESMQVRDTGTTKGFGVYCTQPLEKHTFLGFYEGTLLGSREELETMARTSMDYVMSTDGGATFLDGYERAQDRRVMSPVHLNHQDRGTERCNCLRILEGGLVAFFTARPVLVGEELCFDYGDNFWKGRESEKIS